MATTMTRIADEANVSVSLVSRLLRRDETLKVTDDTRQRIMETCEHLGGVQSLDWTQKKSRRCRVVVPVNRINAHREVYPLVDSPIGRYLERHLNSKGANMSVIFFDQDTQFDTFKQLMEDPDYCNALFLGSGVIDSKVEQLLLNKHFPHICLDQKADRYNVNVLYADSMGAMHQVVDHFIELGHQTIGYIGPVKEQRFPLFYGALVEADLTPNPELICDIPFPATHRPDDQQWREMAHKHFSKWIQTAGGKKCTAVHCHNDAMALGVVDAMGELGMTPGKDLSIVGYDNAESRNPDIQAQPILTTIHNPLEDVGERAAQRLLAQFSGEEKKIVHEYIPTYLIERTTTGAPNQ